MTFRRWKAKQAPVLYYLQDLTPDSALPFRSLYAVPGLLQRPRSELHNANFLAAVKCLLTIAFAA